MGLPLVIPSAGFCSCSNLDQERPPSTFPITHKQSSAQPRISLRHLCTYPWDLSFGGRE